VNPAERDAHGDRIFLILPIRGSRPQMRKMGKMNNQMLDGKLWLHR
jgi:hypothetical protein